MVSLQVFSNFGAAPGVDYAGMFSRARGVSLGRSEQLLGEAAERLKFAVATARSGYSTGVALVSVSLDEYISHVRTAVEMAGVARFHDGAVLAVADAGPARDLVGKVQSSIEYLVDVFEASRQDLVQSASAGQAWDEINAPLPLQGFMGGYEVALAGMERHVFALKQTELWRVKDVSAVGADVLDAENARSREVGGYAAN